MDYVVRPCTPTDETSWLRCRVLAFLETQDFRDVVVPRTAVRVTRHVRPVRTSV